MEYPSVYDVIVVGCGVSGVAALSRLHQNGLKVLGLEGGHRIGGRVWTVSVPGGEIDMGAEYCAGEKNNIVYQMSKDLGVLIEDTDYFPIPILTNGEIIDHKKALKLEELRKEITDELDEENVDVGVSIGQYFEEKYTKIIKHEKYSDISSSLKGSWLDWIRKSCEVEEASHSWYDVTAKNDTVYEECEGNSIIGWKHGYKTILDILLKRIPKPSEEVKLDIKLNKEVAAIHYSNANGTSRGPAILQCTDGSEYKCKSVIVTVSLGVLKARHETMFRPELPTRKITAINSLGFGSLVKVQLHFRVKWWGNAKGYGHGVIWTDEDKNSLEKEDRWLLGLCEISTPASDPNALTMWLAGQCAKDSASVPDVIMKTKVMDLLRKMFGNRKDIPEPEVFLRSTWYTNPLFRGTYSYQSVEAAVKHVSRADIVKPIVLNGRSVVCFAGEATNTIHYSTVHGAVESGFREADRLIKEIV